MQEIKVKIEDGKRSYKIYVEDGLISNIGSMPDVSWKGKNVFILTDPGVPALYLKEVEESLKKAGAAVHSKKIDGGELSKSLDKVGIIYHEMLELRLDRDTVLVCLGGGVIGDLGGFVAATFLRGIGFIQVPTTLLAQVDSSVGGKVGVNLTQGKNLAGAFYQPKAVYIDPAVLATLDEKQWRAGMAEVVKYGMIWDEEFFKFLENIYSKSDMKGKPVTDKKDIARIIATSCKIKAEVVAKDEKESDLRRILNFGHTFGHGLEKMGRYRDLFHGEAVAIGMVQACHLAENLKGLSPDIRLRLVKLLENIGLPTRMPKDFAGEISAVYKVMTVDKKKKNDRIIFVLPKEIGEVYIDETIEKEGVIKVLEQSLDNDL